MAEQRSFRVTHNRACVSLGLKEVEFNSGQTLDASIFITEGDIPVNEFTREENTDELTGTEEPTRIYYRGRTGSANWTFNKASASQLLLALGFGMGDVTTVAAGTGYQHTIVPLARDESAKSSLPSFSYGYRMSELNDIKYDGCIVDTFTVSFTRGAQAEFVTASAGIKMSGKVTESVAKEVVVAAEDATTFALSYGVHGADADERLLSIHGVEAELTGGYKVPVTVNAVSDDTAAAELTIEAAGTESGNINFNTVFTKYDSKITFPALISETPFKTSRTSVTIGGTWNGTSFQGGRELLCPLKMVEWTYTNGITLETCFGTEAEYADRAWKEARTQTLKVDRELRDYIYQSMLTEEEYFGLRLIAEGAVYDDPHKFTFEVIFPRLALKSDAISADGKRLSESMELVVLEDEAYGSVIVNIKCTVPAVAS